MRLPRYSGILSLLGEVGSLSLSLSPPPSSSSSSEEASQEGLRRRRPAASLSLALPPSPSLSLPLPPSPSLSLPLPPSPSLSLPLPPSPSLSLPPHLVLILKAKLCHHANFNEKIWVLSTERQFRSQSTYSQTHHSTQSQWSMPFGKILCSRTWIQS